MTLLTTDTKRLVTNAWIYRIQAYRASHGDAPPEVLPVTHGERTALRTHLPYDSFDLREPYSVMKAMDVRVVSLDPLDHVDLTEDGARSIIDAAMQANGFKPGEVPRWVFDAVMRAGRRS